MGLVFGNIFYHSGVVILGGTLDSWLLTGKRWQLALSLEEHI